MPIAKAKKHNERYRKSLLLSLEKQAYFCIAKRHIYEAGLFLFLGKNAVTAEKARSRQRIIRYNKAFFRVLLGKYHKKKEHSYGGKGILIFLTNIIQSEIP